MIRDFAHYILFTVDEVRDLPNIPDSLVKYVEENKGTFIGQDLLYSPRVQYPEGDFKSPTGRKRFRPANIIMSSAPYGPSGDDAGIKTIYSISFEEVDSEVRDDSCIPVTKEFDKDGTNYVYKATVPAEKEKWWHELKDSATVGYLWTGVYFMEVFKFDIGKTAFVKDSTKVPPLGLYMAADATVVG